MKHDYRKIRKGFAVFVTLLLLLTPLTSAQLIQSYTYDPNGNMVSDGTYCYTYNDANQLSQAKNCSNSQLIAEYVYDSAGQRAIKKQYNGGALKYTVYYIGETYETKIYANGSVENTSYYFVNGERIASKDKKGITYYHSDHLGSASVLTNAAGALVEETSYYPFGAIKSGGTQSKFLYTGQENDPETGLYYYGARYYDPELMRFAQADKIIPDIYDPQSLNRYSYVKNNPLKYTDPTGETYEWGIINGLINGADGVGEMVLGGAIFAAGVTIGTGSAIVTIGSWGFTTPVTGTTTAIGYGGAVVGLGMFYDGLITAVGGVETIWNSACADEGTPRADEIDQRADSVTHPMFNGLLEIVGVRKDPDSSNTAYGIAINVASNPSGSGFIKAVIEALGLKVIMDDLKEHPEKIDIDNWIVRCSPEYNAYYEDKYHRLRFHPEVIGPPRPPPPCVPQKPPASPTDPNQENKDKNGQ